MLTKDELLESLLHECDIATHLVSRIPEGGLDHRPCDGQRSNLETLRYLAFCAIGGARYLVDGNWDGYSEWEAKAADVGIADYATAMDAQKQALTALFAGLSDDDLQREVQGPLGNTMRLERGLLDMPLKWMVGYRMQLFLGVKSAGNDEIWTPDCWYGISKPRDTQPA